MDLRLTYSSDVIEAVTNEFDGTTTLIVKGVEEVNCGKLFREVQNLNLSQMHEGMLIAAMEETLDAITLQQAMVRGIKRKERV